MMSEGTKPDREVLADREVAELLARASELDAQRANGSEVEDLRAAATQAGISARSFDTALAQIRQERSALPLPAPASRRTRKSIFAASLVVALFGGALLMHTSAPTDSSVPADAIVEGRIGMGRCLTGAEAAELVRPILSLASNRVTVSPDGRMLILAATRPQLQQVRAVLLEQEQTAPACAR